MFLREFTFSNFYSFRDEHTVRFGVGAHSPDKMAYITTPSGARVSKVMGIFGANASGKSNLLKVLYFAKCLICDSFSLGTEKQLPYLPFFGDNSSPRESTLRIDFQIADSIFRYDLNVELNRILRETLYRKPDEKGEKFAYIFKRTWRETSGSYSLTSKGLRVPPNFEGMLRNNSSLLNTAALLNEPTCKRIRDAWNQSKTNLDELGKAPYWDLRDSAVETYRNNPDILERANQLVSTFDLGLREFAILEVDNPQRESPEPGTHFAPFGYHARENGNEALLPFILQSGGTQTLFNYLAMILPVLRDGGIAAIDELDAELHPRMLERIIELFVDEDTNPGNGQLLFTSHYAPILQLLDKYQITLVERTEVGESDLWRLDEMKGVRADDNYFMRYVAGAYGAVPEI